MTDRPVEAPADERVEKPAAAVSPVEKRVRRTMLSTGFSDVPGKVCEICGYEGFRWQTACPQGHPLA